MYVMVKLLLCPWLIFLGNMLFETGRRCSDERQVMVSFLSFEFLTKFILDYFLLRETGNSEKNTYM